MSAPRDVLLRATGLTKSYGYIRAVEDFDVTIRAGEILAIVGDNGAGKSTVVKMLSGVVALDRGEIEMDGEPVHLATPYAARVRGIETVFQDLALAPNRDVVDNLFLGRELYRGGLLRPFRILMKADMHRQASAELRDLEINIPRMRGTHVERLSGGQQQAVAIARAASCASRILFMDEPTAALGVQQSAAVLRLAREVAGAGLGVVMVSHALPHVLDLADRIIVMRNGRKVEETTATIKIEDLISLIVGADPQVMRERATHAELA